jgi:hypothetical protein
MIIWTIIVLVLAVLFSAALAFENDSLDVGVFFSTFILISLCWFFGLLLALL